MIFLFIVIALIFTGCANLFFGDDEIDYEDDTPTHIDADYNGDGEKDAEDYRIQTEGTE
jgi:hypothetical protein